MITKMNLRGICTQHVSSLDRRHPRRLQSRGCIARASQQITILAIVSSLMYLAISGIEAAVLRRR
jgi:hypothetical protein